MGLSGENNILDAEQYKYIHTVKKQYGIGWENYQNKNIEISEHSGSDGTFFCYAQIERKKLIGYVVIVNSGTANAQKGVFEMIKVMKNKYNR